MPLLCRLFWKQRLLKLECLWALGDGEAIVKGKPHQGILSAFTLVLTLCQDLMRTQVANVNFLTVSY